MQKHPNADPMEQHDATLQCVRTLSDPGSALPPSPGHVIFTTRRSRPRLSDVCRGRCYKRPNLRRSTQA